MYLKLNFLLEKKSNLNVYGLGISGPLRTVSGYTSLHSELQLFNQNVEMCFMDED